MAHSRLSASGSKIWMACPASPSVSEGMPNYSSPDAQLGTDTHELLSDCIMGGMDPENVLGVEFPSGNVVDPGMVQSVRTVLGYLGEQTDTVEIYSELELSLSRFDPDMPTLTADVVAHWPDLKTIEVIDYKNGMIPVGIEGNSQLRMYGLAVLYRLDNADIETIHLTIIQPNAPHSDGPIRTESLYVSELLAWAENILKPAAERTRAADPEFAPGPACQYCPGRLQCPMLDTMQARLQDPVDVYDPLVIGSLMQNAAILKKRISAIEEHAYQQAMLGNVPEGHKLVRKRAMRKWNDVAEAVAALTDHGLSGDDIHETKILSPAKVEKMLGKEGKSIVGRLARAESSGLTVVSLDDKRESVTPENL